MRGEADPQHVFAYFSPDARVPAGHPLRSIKTYAEAAVERIDAELDALYGTTAPPPIPPERLLRGQLLSALYSIRSDRAFCEQRDYNLLYRWFLDMSLEERGLDQSNFSRLRERLVDTDVARRFSDEVVRLARGHGLLSAERCTVDSTLIESWAGLKSLRRKGGGPPNSGGDGAGMADFRGERRTNDTHESTTDPEAWLMRRGNGQPVNLGFGGYELMENRSGLCVDVALTDARLSEPTAAIGLLKGHAGKRVRPTTLGADKGYHTTVFVQALRERSIRPHLARIDDRMTPGIDGRTRGMRATNRASARASGSRRSSAD